jgi:hypothetical protein
MGNLIPSTYFCRNNLSYFLIYFPIMSINFFLFSTLVLKRNANIRPLLTSARIFEKKNKFFFKELKNRVLSMF